MKRIQAKEKSIGLLLQNRRFSIDDYQREYKWTTKQVEELLTDLSMRFSEEWDESHGRSAVASYGGYFLGSVVLSDTDDSTVSLIVDGQQRITTLTLLLMYMHGRTKGRDDVRPLGDLILSWAGGRRAFNLDIDERTPTMEAIYRGEIPDPNGQSESVRNIIKRYSDIVKLFPGAIPDEALDWFVDWLVEKVVLVEITAFSNDDAYTIFETMNDRGLSLTPLEMLKGWLLANISEDAKRTQAGNTWIKRTEALKKLGKDEDTDAVKSWLRSQYANSIRERRKNAQPLDFDRLGTEFHRWLRENREGVGLNEDDDFFQFVHNDLTFYTRWYERLRQASSELTEGLEPIYYLGQYRFTLQYPVLMAPLRPDEPESVSLTKLRLVGTYLDILLARRLWHSKRISYSTMQYAMFLVMQKARGLAPPALSKLLLARLEEEGLQFRHKTDLRVHQQNRNYIQHILARLTDHIERQSGLPGRFVEYIGGQGTSRYEVEHIWANHPERHTAEFPQAADFLWYRDRIGGLVLLPKSFNASYGDLPYDQKVEHYVSQNILAWSLHSGAYTHNPGFLRHAHRSGLPFRAVKTFNKSALDDRQDLYRRIADEVWSPRRLELLT